MFSPTITTQMNMECAWAILDDNLIMINLTICNGWCLVKWNIHSILWPGIVLFMFMLPFIFVIVCSFFLVKRICAGSLLCVCIYVLSLEIQLSTGSARIPLPGLNSSHFCACPLPGPGCPTSYIVVDFVFSEFS